jgi:hypothetical protein
MQNARNSKENHIVTPRESTTTRTTRTKDEGEYEGQTTKVTESTKE